MCAKETGQPCAYTQVHWRVQHTCPLAGNGRWRYESQLCSIPAAACWIWYWIHAFIAEVQLFYRWAACLLGSAAFRAVQLAWLGILLMASSGLRDGRWSRSSAVEGCPCLLPPMIAILLRPCV